MSKAGCFTLIILLHTSVFSFSIRVIYIALHILLTRDIYDENRLLFNPGSALDEFNSVCVCVCVCVVHMQPLRNLPSLSAVLIATVGSSLTGCYIDPAHRDAANSLQASPPLLNRESRDIFTVCSHNTPGWRIKLFKVVPLFGAC